MRGLLKGIPVSEGIAIGTVFKLESPWDEVISVDLSNDQITIEQQRYQTALKEVDRQLIECRDRVRREIGVEEARIFEAHLAILKDAFFQDGISGEIASERKNAEYLLKSGLEKWNRSFESMDNDHFRLRFDDIRDVSVRILRILLQTEEISFPTDKPAILVAHSLTPSDTARIDRVKIVGFATELGGLTSHASILARSMGIPAVVGVERLMKSASDGDMLIVDGNSGILHIDPPNDLVTGYEKRKKQFNVYWQRLAEEATLEAVTTDGTSISLKANVGITADIGMALKYCADGIGLFRTELPFLIAGRLLGEEEQFKLYRTVAESMGSQSVTIRTLDLGGDKFLPFQGIEKESNPFLGWRSIRIFLQERDVFKIQLRAILRASYFGRVRIMFPMISSMEEILQIREVLDETKDDLKHDGIPFDEEIKMGIMIEVPSAAILSHQLIRHVDFFSIGTNDLIQYALAVDRNNERVARFYQPLNPAILHLIRKTVDAALCAGKPVSLCGEMAGNPIYTVMLLGLGLRELSMSPLMLPEVKERVRAISIDECESVRDMLLEKDSADEIEKALWAFHFHVNKRQPVPFIEKSSMKEWDNNSETLPK